MSGRGRTGLAVLALLLGFALLTAGSAAQLDRTADEEILWRAGGAILDTGSWESVTTRFQGPIPLYANQLLTRGETGRELTAAILLRARLGMLGFGILAGLVVFLWSRSLFGNGAGFLALATFALQPLLVGYGALVAVDMAHAACLLAALFLLWRFAERPTWPRLVATGVGLGVALATKYLVLLVAPVFAFAVAVRVAQHRRVPRGTARALLLGAGHAAALAAVALATLHGTYGFLAGFAPAAAEGYASDLVAGWIASPLLGPPLRLLPSAFLLGVDYQVAMGAGQFEPFLDGRFAPGHPGYYLWSILYKTPEALLAVGLVVGLRGLPRWLGRAAEARVRWAAALILAAILVPSCYLSLFSRLQVGIRYVLPAFPLALVLLGGVVRDPWLAGRSARLRRAAAGLFLALLAAELPRWWPDGIAYYNRISGGPARAYRHFTDSNSDWGQMRRRGPEEIAARHPGRVVSFLERGDGPRFGLVATYVRFRMPPDPEHPDRPRHWVDPFEEVDHAGAAWQVYDVTPEAFAAAARSAGDERVRADHAAALLGAGDVEGARREIRGLGGARAGVLGAQADALEAWRSDPTDVRAGLSLGRGWLTLGRPDLAADLALAPPLAREHAAALLLVRARTRQGRFTEAIEHLLARGVSAGEPELLLRLVDLYRRTGRFEDAVPLLEAALPALEGTYRARAEEALEAARRHGAAWRDLGRDRGEVLDGR